MLELAPGHVDLWVLSTDDVRDVGLRERYQHLLTPEERERAARFHLVRDRQRYEMTRALVRTTLSRYAPVALESCRFVESAYGKPQVANAELRARELSFNVSHTDGLIVLGLARDRSIGVGAENVSREAPVEVANRFFAAEEIHELLALPHELRSERFFDYWTLKEPYINPRGMGLALALDQFSFGFPRPDTILLSVSAALNDQELRWRFLQCRLRAEYVLTICVERTPGQREQLHATRVVPLAGEYACELCIVRRS